MATVRQGSRRGDVPVKAVATPREAQPKPEPETYSWQEAPTPVTRVLTHREQTQTTVALCIFIGVFGGVAVGLIALSILQLDGSERFVAAGLCLIVAALMATLICYLVVTPLDAQRQAPARQRAASSRASRARP